MSGAATGSERLSAIEALRLLSMFMVLVLHADYAALGAPSWADFQSSPAGAVVRVVAEQLSVVAVNVFVLISGWFGIRTTRRGVVALVFQVLFYAVAVIAAAALTFGIDSPATAWLTLVPGYHHWFIRSYLGLMVLAPVLNAFIGRASVGQLAAVTGAFLLFETVYGWIICADGFLDGYSVLSFTGLYLLAATARRLRWQRPGAFRWGCVYLLCAVLSSSASLVMLRLTGKVPPSLTAYDSPLVIVAALALMLAFAGAGSWRSRFVNRMAASCLAVYLLHFNPLIFKYYLSFCRRIYHAFDSVACVAVTALFLCAVFAASILVDRLRLAVWKILEKRVFMLRE